MHTVEYAHHGTLEANVPQRIRVSAGAGRTAREGLVVVVNHHETADLWFNWNLWDGTPPPDEIAPGADDIFLVTAKRHAMEVAPDHEVSEFVLLAEVPLRFSIMLMY